MYKKQRFKIGSLDGDENHKLVLTFEIVEVYKREKYKDVAISRNSILTDKELQLANYYFPKIDLNSFKTKINKNTMYNEPMLKEGALKGKTIIVTGGGTGLGKSMTKYFLELGANVVITSRKMDVLEKTAQELEDQTGGKVLACCGRRTKNCRCGKNHSRGFDKFGQVDGLLNNAAGNFISPTERLSVKAFDVVIGIVLQGSYNYTLTLGKEWIDRKLKGTILNIVTTYAWTGSGYVVPSACAKSGVLALTRSLAVEWAKYGIRSNAIAPGPFPTTGAWDRLFPKNLRDKFDP